MEARPTTPVMLGYLVLRQSTRGFYLSCVLSPDLDFDLDLCVVDLRALCSRYPLSQPFTQPLPALGNL